MKRIVWTLTIVVALLIVNSCTPRADWVTTTVAVGNGPGALK
jgi:hypothetical protein